MTTIPTGLPAWSRTSDASTYGGHADKRNYQLQTVVNPKTDVGADEFIRLAADVACLARVAAFCTGVIQCEDTPAATPAVTDIRQMTAISASGYVGNSPTHSSFPTVARLGDGAVTITWPTSVSDEYGVSADVVINHAHAWLVGNPTGYYVVTTMVNNVVTLSAFTIANTAYTDATIAFEVA